MDIAMRLSREMVRETLIGAGNERLAGDSCPLHKERAYLSQAASGANIVISGCCDIYIGRAATGMGFRVDKEVQGGRPTLLLSAALQIL